MNNSEFLSRIRYSGYLGRVMSAEDAATFIRPGMVLGVYHRRLPESSCGRPCRPGAEGRKT